MKQLEFDLEWLTDEKHKFKSVRHIINKSMNNCSYNDYLAKKYGYKNYQHMLTHNNKKYNEEKLKYGDRVLNGWL